MTPKDWNEMKKLLADVAKGNDVQEVLTKLSNGVAGVTAQTKRFTEIASGLIEEGGTLAITGQGRIQLIPTSYNQTKISADITIDGVPMERDGSYLAAPLTLYFEKSINIAYKSNGNSTYYLVQT